jgi:2-keto-4-pentenoate hydratase/2-oxohepta-3-ene-1,7-dioic acid hydratase in catechol pathway
MKILRYQDRSGHIHVAQQNPDLGFERLEGDMFSRLTPTGEVADVVKILAPVAPPAIFCVGLNYRRHAAETGARVPEIPILFMKGPNTVQNSGDPICIPTQLASDEVDYECELAVVIGKTAKNVKRGEAFNHILGYTAANDVSARDWQIKKGGSQWCRGKTFDTFCPLGPVLVTPDEIPNPNDLGIRTILNGETVQDCNTNDMIFDVPSLIEFLSGSTTLFPGTVILTGTPHGVGMAANPPRWLKPGDSVTIEIDRIGALINPVALE